MATRKDVAALAGVSTTSVTNVINGRHRVSDDVRRRVLEAVRRLDYRPHPVARALATKSTKQVVIVAHFFSNPFYGQLFQELTGQLHAEGFHCIAINSACFDAGYISAMLAGHCDGLIVLDGSLPVGILAEFRGKGLPVAAQGYEYCAEIPSIEPDFAGGMDQVVEHLTNLGHTRIAFITSHPATESNQRYLEYQRALARRGMTCDQSLVVAGTPPYLATAAAGYRLTAELLERKTDMTAIIAYADLIAFGASRALREAGLRIPGDISLVGWDNIAIAQYIDPPLTTVHSATDDLAAALRQSLTRQMAGAGVEMLTQLTTTLIVRQSSGISPAYRR